MMKTIFVAAGQAVAGAAILIAVALALAVSGLLVGTAAAGPIEAVRAGCIERYPNDHTLQLACYERQLEALGWIKEYNLRYPPGTAEGEILVTCVGQFIVRDRRGDAALARACATRQLAAKRTLEAVSTPSDGR